MDYNDKLNELYGRSKPEPARAITASHEPSRPVLICASGLMAAFFMPWFQLLGMGVTGYQIGKIGSYGNYAWIIPILAGATILASLTHVNNRIIGGIAGAVPLFALIYGIVRFAAEADATGFDQITQVIFHVLSIGAYLTLTFSVGLVLTAFTRNFPGDLALLFNHELRSSARTTDLLRRLEHLESLRGQGLISEVQFDKEKRKILQ